MRKKVLIGLGLILLVFNGCATRKATNHAPQYSPPSIVKVTAPLKASRGQIERLQGVLAVQPIDQTAKDLEQIQANIVSAEKFSADLEKEINNQTAILNQVVAEKNRALEQVEYWHGKQVKALKELWIYRSIIIGLVSLLAVYVLIRLGIIGGKLLL